MKKAVIINGFGGSGKDTFIEILKKIVNLYPYTYDIKIYSYSSVDKIKEAAKFLGWDGYSKTEKDRRFLFDLKKLVTEYNDGCTNYMEDCFNDANSLIKNKILIFFHIREPKEIDKLKNKIDAIVIYVKNDNVPRNEHNLEDRDIENYPYDYIVNNSGTLEDLNKEAYKFIEWINENYFRKDV